MIRRRARPGLRIAVLVALTAVTLGINFAHTEKCLGDGKDCPACHFLTSSLSTSPGLAFFVAALLYQGTLPAPEPLGAFEVVVRSTSSRSPPQA